MMLNWSNFIQGISTTLHVAILMGIKLKPRTRTKRNPTKTPSRLCVALWGGLQDTPNPDTPFFFAALHESQFTAN